jgi:DDE superfamily endonuclease
VSCAPPCAWTGSSPRPVTDARAPTPRVCTPASGTAKFEGRLHAAGGPGGFADTAYTGTGLCVPQRKPKGHNLIHSAREYNRVIASRRASVERVIAHLKNWKLLATGCRGLLDRFPTFLDAITKLEIYRTS